MSVKSPPRQHTPRALLVGLPALVISDLERTLATLAIKTSTERELSNNQAFDAATHLFACDNTALDIAKHFSQKKFIVAVFLSTERTLLMSFFKAGGAAAIRYPWPVHELSSKLKLMFGSELHV